MKIVMLNDVTPQMYGLKGQYGWEESVQWEKGQVYIEDDYLARMFINNDDAISATDYVMQAFAASDAKLEAL